MFTVISVAAHVSPSLMEREPLTRLSHQIRTLVMRLIQRGQELGVIRTDYLKNCSSAGSTPLTTRVITG